MWKEGKGHYPVETTIVSDVLSLSSKLFAIRKMKLLLYHL